MVTPLQVSSTVHLHCSVHEISVICRAPNCNNLYKKLKSLFSMDTLALIPTLTGSHLLNIAPSVDSPIGVDQQRISFKITVT